MLLNKIKRSGKRIAIPAALAVALGAAAVAAHAQVYCRWVQAHPAGDLVCGIYGCVVVPCTHWIWVCN